MASFHRYLLLLLPLFQLSVAKAVFCHYMVGSITDAHARQDIVDAKGLGFSAFALNVGDPTQPFVRDTLDSLFNHAKEVGFKLYISIDLYASGNSCYSRRPECNTPYACFQKNPPLTGCNGPFDYSWIWSRYDVWNGNSGYYQVDGRPFISTFSSGGLTIETWTSWRKGLGKDIWFVPDFDETEGYYSGADGWWYYWGPVVDGIFSWETAWPERDGRGGGYSGDVSADVPALNGARAHLKTYMMGLSPLQYKDSYGANVYRAGDLNLPIRMENILAMKSQPDYVEFQTWNDGPESHYIGNLWPESNEDSQPGAYANDKEWSHAGWRSLVASFNDAFLNGKTSSAGMVPKDGLLVTGALWYKTINPFTVVCTARDDKYYQPPEGFQDGSQLSIWSVVLSPAAASGHTVTVWSQGDYKGTARTETLTAGLNYGIGRGIPIPGAQNLEIKDQFGSVIASASKGACVSAGCPSGIYNSNYQVVPVVKNAGDYSNCPNLVGISPDAPRVCSLMPETSNDGFDAASLAASEVWTDSAAGAYLAQFLETEASGGRIGADANNAWTFDFFNTVVQCGSLSGRTNYDCTSLESSSSCTGPAVGSCNLYCPPEAYYIHTSIFRLFGAYRSVKDALLQRSVAAITTSAKDIANTFAPVDTQLPELLKVVSGVLSTISAISAFAGSFDAPLVNAFGTGVGAFSAIFSNAAGNLPAAVDQTGNIQDLIATTITSLMAQADNTITKLFAADGQDLDADLIKATLSNGAWLNPEVVTAVVNGTVDRFISAMNQHAINTAMRSSSNDGPYASGWALLYSEDDFNTKAKCDILAKYSMIWFDNKCMGFGHYTQSLSGGPNGVIISRTSWLSSSENQKLTSYVPNLALAIINSYQCSKGPGHKVRR